MKKKFVAMMLTAFLAASTVACGSSSQAPAGETAATEVNEAKDTTTTDTAEKTEAAADTTASGEPKILKAAASFAYPSLDVHKEYYGWYTSIYGISEALFKMDENSSVVPCLAKEAVADGNVWTVTLNDGVAFSNGNALTADMVVRNLKRAAEVNSRFAYLADFTIEAVDDKTFTITTTDVYPTMKNDLATPELGIVDLDNTTDFDNAPVCTGPFVIETFVPEGDVTVAKNTITGAEMLSLMALYSTICRRMILSFLLCRVARLTATTAYLQQHLRFIMLSLTSTM